VLTAALRSVLVKRQAGNTLDDIAKELGVTRERVRQLETKAHRQLQVVLAGEENLMSAWKYRLATPGVGEERLLSPYTESGGDVDSQLLVGRLCLTLMGAKHPRTFSGKRLKMFWTFKPESLIEALRKLALIAPCEYQEMSANAVNLELDPSLPLHELLEQSGSPVRYHAELDAWIRSTPHDRDAAWIVLQRRGAPTRAEDLSSLLDVPQHNLEEAMRRDKRFTQLTPSGKWAISDWNVKESDYKSTIDAVIAVLTEQGPQRLAQLTRKVIARYPVSPSAVAQCVAHMAIGRWPDGRIDLVIRGAPQIRDSTPVLPSDVFPEEGGQVLAIRKPVTRDLLRGSGTGLSRYVSWALNMKSAPEERVFATSTGEAIVVRKRIQGTNISSLRSFARRLGAGEGCELIVRLKLADGSADVVLGCSSGACVHAFGNGQALLDAGR
jgi:hypothetical protein